MREAGWVSCLGGGCVLGPAIIKVSSACNGVRYATCIWYSAACAMCGRGILAPKSFPKTREYSQRFRH